MNTFLEKLKKDAENQVAYGGIIKTDGEGTSSLSKKGGLTSFSAGRASDVLRVNPYVIEEEEGFNSRNWDDLENQAHIEDLAKNIAHRGLQKPLEVRWDRARKDIVLVDGHCRLRAVKMAIEVYGKEISFVLVTTGQGQDNPYDRIIKTISDNSGKTNSILEKAAQIRKLMSISGKSVEMVARDLTSELQSVKLWLEQESVINAAPDIRKLILAGNISLSMGVSTLKTFGYDQDKAFQAISNALERRKTQLDVLDGFITETLPTRLEGLSENRAASDSASDSASEIAVTTQPEKRKPIKILPKHLNESVIDSSAASTTQRAKKTNLRNEMKKIFRDTETDNERYDLLLLRFNKKTFIEICGLLSMKPGDFECLTPEWFA